MMLFFFGLIAVFNALWFEKPLTKVEILLVSSTEISLMAGIYLLAFP